tara:strand:+ start:2660 stop:3130 length:471 start_codon:yes stop_codon:yes gene_type:complete
MRLNAIYELFDTPVPIIWEERGPTRWFGSFNVNNKQYVLRMVTMNDASEWIQSPWEVSFDLIRNGKSTQSITGTGDAARVFATVIYGIKKWLHDVQPHSFSLSAREPSRVKLYDRMLRMLPKQWVVDNYDGVFMVNDKSKVLQKTHSDDDYDDYGD